MNIEELVDWHKKNKRKSMSYTSDDGGCVVVIVGERYAVAGPSIKGANFTIDEQEGVNSMAYEYKDEIENAIIESFVHVEGAAFDELDEVYRKARAFDAIIDIEDDFVKYHGFSPCVEEYAEEVEEIINEYKERAADET